MATFALVLLLAASKAEAADETCGPCGRETWGVLCSNRDNLTALNTITAPAWVVESELRGTFSILQTCLLTLFTCIFTALHLNVPDGIGFWSNLGAKLKWAALSLIGPELVVFTAAKQFLEAWILSTDLKELQENVSDGSEDKTFDFNLRYAFFVTMGGLRVRLSDLSEHMTAGDMDGDWYMYLELLSTFERGTVQITGTGVLELARSGHFIKISPTVVSDRSKANSLQKVLVVIQVSWLVLSCIARKAYGLPLTLLEIHTMVHVVCAFIMYMFWFKKPLDVQDGEVVSLRDEWGDVVALMVQRSFYYFQSGLSLKVRDTTGADVVECVYHEGQRTELSEVVGLGCQAYSSSSIHMDLELADEKTKQKFFKDAPAEKVTKRWHRAANALIQRGLSPEKLQEESCNFWGLDAGKEDAACFSKGKNLHFDYEEEAQFDFTSLFLGILDKEDFAPAAALALAVILILPALYGGIHLTAWGYESPTPSEKLLWRISCISIMCTTPIIVLVELIEGLIIAATFPLRFGKRGGGRRESPQRERIVTRRISWAKVTFWDWTWGLLGLFYLFCRVFIVVESFLSLRSVPIGVFWTPAWLQMLPHV